MSTKSCPSKSRKRTMKPKNVPGAKRQLSTWPAKSMTSYTPFFRRINTGRQFTLLKQSFQGFIPGGVASEGSCVFTTCSFQNPFTSPALFTAAAMGLGVTTGLTSLAQNYPGSIILQAQYLAYRIHSRKLTVQCVPSLAGDGVTVAMYPSVTPTPTFPLSYGNIVGQSHAKACIAMFGSGKPGRISTKLKAHQMIGLTREQWDAQAPTNQATIPIPALQFYDLIHWSTIDGGALAGNLNFTFELEVEIEFSEPQMLLR